MPARPSHEVLPLPPIYSRLLRRGDSPIATSARVQVTFEGSPMLANGSKAFARGNSPPPPPPPGGRAKIWAQYMRVYGDILDSQQDVTCAPSVCKAPSKAHPWRLGLRTVWHLPTQASYGCAHAVWDDHRHVVHTKRSRILPTGLKLGGTMGFGSTAKVLAECKLKYYRISEWEGPRSQKQHLHSRAFPGLRHDPVSHDQVASMGTRKLACACGL